MHAAHRSRTLKRQTQYDPATAREHLYDKASEARRAIHPTRGSPMSQDEERAAARRELPDAIRYVVVALGLSEAELSDIAADLLLEIVKSADLYRSDGRTDSAVDELRELAKAEIGRAVSAAKTEADAIRAAGDALGPDLC